MEGSHIAADAPVGMPSSQPQPLPSFLQPPKLAANSAVVPGKQPQVKIRQASSSPRSILQQGPEMPQIQAPPRIALQQGVEVPQIVPPYKGLVQQGPEMPQVVGPENPLRAALRDRTGGALLLDAMTAECGHTFGGASLQKVLAVGTCNACGIPVDPGRLIPNLAVRAAAAAFEAEESLDGDLRLKRAREGELGRGTLPFIREPEQKAYVFPYKLHDRVRVKGNKRTPPHFVGKEAVIVHEGLNGWYTVRLKESGEETRLQYRSLEALADEKKMNGPKGEAKQEKGKEAGLGSGEKEKGGVDEGTRKRVRTEGEDAAQSREGAQSGGEGASRQSGLAVNQGEIRARAAVEVRVTDPGSSDAGAVETSLKVQETPAAAEKVNAEGGPETSQTSSQSPAVTLPLTSQTMTVQVIVDVPRIRGGAPSADSPRESLSPRPWGPAGSGCSPLIWNPGHVSPTGLRKRTERRPALNLGFLARISADVSDDERSVGPSSGRGDTDSRFEGHFGDRVNAGVADVGLDEERGFGGGVEKAEAKSTPQKLLSVPERDRCVKSNGRGWRCKLRKASGYQYCEHHQRNWDGHEKQWKKAFPSPEGALSQPPGSRVKVAGAGGPKRPKEGRRLKAKVKGAKLKKQALFLAETSIEAYGLGPNGMLVHKKSNNLAAKRLERALKDARGAGAPILGQLYKSARQPGFSFAIDGDDFDSDDYDLPPTKHGKLPRPELDPFFLSQKRIEKAQKYKTLVANKEYIEDDRGNLKVLEVMGGPEPSEEELLAQVERVCPELDLDKLCSVDITAAVAAVAAMGREEAEILLGRLLMRHSCKELAEVQEVIDQEKRIVLAKLEDLNRRDAAKAEWKKRPFLGFGEGGPPKKKRSVNLVKTGRVPRLFSTLFPSEFGDLDEDGNFNEGEGGELGVTGGVKNEVRGSEPNLAVFGEGANPVEGTVSAQEMKEDGEAPARVEEMVRGSEEEVREAVMGGGCESFVERGAGDLIGSRLAANTTGASLMEPGQELVESEKADLREAGWQRVGVTGLETGSPRRRNAGDWDNSRFGSMPQTGALCYNLPLPEAQYRSKREPSGSAQAPETEGFAGVAEAYTSAERRSRSDDGFGHGFGRDQGGVPELARSPREGARQAGTITEPFQASPKHSNPEVGHVSGRAELMLPTAGEPVKGHGFGPPLHLKGFSGPSRTYSNSYYDCVNASPAPYTATVEVSPRAQKAGQHRNLVGGFDLGLDMFDELDDFAQMGTRQGDETDDSESE